MSGYLIALDKQPGVPQVRVVETCGRLFYKIVLKVAGPKATSTCQDDKIRAGLKAVIDGAVHRVRSIWYSKLTTEYWVFFS